MLEMCFDDPFVDGQFFRTLSYIPYGGADLSECLSAAARMTPGDADA